ncbi:MAG TPA: hypothetical protein PKN64_16855, partial [Casimicrobium sp.]|nr:hypothetical protein [Casimicrobium sp.]
IKEKRIDMVVDTVQKLVVPKVLEKYGAAETQIEYLISTLDDEQLGALAEKLRPDQIPLFVEVARKIDAKKEAAAKAANEAESERKKLVRAAETAENGTTIEDILVKDTTEK